MKDGTLSLRVSRPSFRVVHTILRCPAAVRVLHHPTGIIITRETGRSQDTNLKSALAQLEEELKRRSKSKVATRISEHRQVIGEGVKTFTHNYQRGEVTTLVA